MCCQHPSRRCMCSTGWRGVCSPALSPTSPTSAAPSTTSACTQVPAGAWTMPEWMHVMMQLNLHNVAEHFVGVVTPLMRQSAWYGAMLAVVSNFVGGRGVIEGLGSQLKLDEHQRQPSAQTLYHYGAPGGHWCRQCSHCIAAVQPGSELTAFLRLSFLLSCYLAGNTSSSTVWYSLGFIESCQGVRRGDIVWQVSTSTTHAPVVCSACCTLQEPEAVYMLQL